MASGSESDPTRGGRRTSRGQGRFTSALVVVVLVAVASLTLLRREVPHTPPVPDGPLPPGGESALHISWERNFEERVRGLILTRTGPTVGLFVGNSTEASLVLARDQSEMWLRNLTLELPYCCATPPMAISQDGRYFAFANDRLSLWNVSANEIMWEFDFPQDGDYIKESALGLALSSDGSRLAAVTMNFAESPPRLWVFDRGGKVSWSRDLPMAYPWSVRMSADGSTLLLSLATGLLAFDASSTALLMNWTSSGWTLSENSDLSEDGRTFAVVSAWGPEREKARLFFLDRAAGLVWTRDLELGAIETSLDLSRDGRRVVVLDRRSGGLVSFDSSGREVFRSQVRGPTSNIVLLEDGTTLMLAEGGRCPPRRC